MEGITNGHIFIKIKLLASLHSCKLPGWWPPLLCICCKSIWLPGCSPLLWTTAHGIVDLLRCAWLCIRVLWCLTKAYKG